MKQFTTSDSIKEIWSHLLFFISAENCIKLLQQKACLAPDDGTIDDVVIEKKASEISFCIQQAHEFFALADNATILSSPLPIYYGMLDLSKALLIANVPRLSLADLKYHGLMSRAINQETREVKENFTDKIEKQIAVVNKGVFFELYKREEGLKPLLKSYFALGDLLPLIPEIQHFFEKYFGVKSRVFKILTSCPSKDINIWFSSLERDITDLLERFPEIEEEFKISVSGFKHPFFSTHTEGIHCGLEESMRDDGKVANVPKTVRFYEGYPIGRYVIGKASYSDENGQKLQTCLSSIVIDFILCFIFCDITRYNVKLWQTICSSESGFSSIISQYLESVKRRFPNEILNELCGEKHIFSSSTIEGLSYTPPKKR